MNKKYIAINSREYEEKDILEQKELYEILKKYKGYEKNIDIENKEKLYQEVNGLMTDLYNLNILCINYREYTDAIDLLTISKDELNKFDILQCLACITFIQRNDHMTGGDCDVYYNYTKYGVIPGLIERMIDIFEENNK